MIEPVSLQEVKEFLRINSGSFSDPITLQSIDFGSHAITVGYALIGNHDDVFGYPIITIALASGTNGVTGTVDVKIQESDNRIIWTDWGTFTQITEANDNVTYEKGYTGSKQYIRVVAKVLLASCEFGVQIKKYSSDSSSSLDTSNMLDISNIPEDVLLNSLITTAREFAEAITRRQFITATYSFYLDAFPNKDFIKLPYGQLQSAIMKYKNSEGIETTMTEGTDYLVDTLSEPGRIVLPYGTSWPSFTPYPINPITVEFVCGYGHIADVPAGIKTAIKIMILDMYENREIQSTQQLWKNNTAENLLAPYRLWNF